MRLREGTQLLGRYEGSAYEQPTYLVRRDDGQVIHLSHLLYLVAALMDGERDLTEIAEALSTQLGRLVVADNVEHLVEKKLRPSGLIAGAPDDDQPKALPRSLPLLALRYRKRVIPARLHRGITTTLQPLFWSPLVFLVLGGFVATNIWLFGAHRTALTRAARQLPFHPNLFLLVTMLVIFSGFFHELGHATATRYGGGSPGVMGVGIYLAWPAFYTDLTDSYRLNRAGRLRADLGGVYFNAVLIVAAGIAYFFTGFGPLAVFIVVSQAMAMYQFLPFVRLDGYYIMSDLVGVPNLFAYLGPVLRSTFHRSDPVTNARLQLLKRRARLAIKIWSVITAVFLAFNFVALAILAPIILPAEWVSIHLQWQAMITAFSRGNLADGVNDLVDLVVVAIAPAGLLLIAGILLRRALVAIKKWWPTHPKVTAVLAAVLAGVLLFQGQGLISRLAAAPASSGSTAMATNGARPADQVSGHTPRSPIVRRAPRPSNVPVISSPSTGAAHLTSVPAASDWVYVVQAGDTLWGIAADNLGDPERWSAIFELNVGRPQPDGRTLVDPDLIYPGWQLEIPGSQPVTRLVAQPRPPVAQTDDAVVAQPSAQPPVRSGLDTSNAGTTPLAAALPASSHPVNLAAQSARGQTPSTDEGTSPRGGTAGETTSRAAVTRVQRHKSTTTAPTPTTTTTTTDPSTPATGTCALSQACRSAQAGMGQPRATLPGSTSPRVPPPNLPASSPRGHLTQWQYPDGSNGHEDMTNGQTPIRIPDERGPPDATGRRRPASEGTAVGIHSPEVT